MWKFHFYSNEGNEAPHIHVTGKGGEMKIWLEDQAAEFIYGISPADQRKIRIVVAENAELFMVKWNEFAGKKI